jgi:hypothetical protein
MASQQWGKLLHVSEGRHRPTQPDSDDSIHQSSSRLPVFPVPAFEIPTPDPNLGYLGEEYGNRDTLQYLGQSSLPATVHVRNWQYNMRYKASQVTPYLYLGPSPEAKNAEFLNPAGIGLLIAVRGASLARAKPKYLNPAYFATADNRRIMTVDFDTPTEFVTQVKPALKAVVDYVRDTMALEQEPAILVFCETGNSRSVAFVAAFTMAIYGFDPAAAMQFLSSRRASVVLDHEFAKMLETLHDVLVATRQVTVATQGISKNDSENKKRGLEDDSDEEMEESGGRPARLTPFVDASD